MEVMAFNLDGRHHNYSMAKLAVFFWSRHYFFGPGTIEDGENFILLCRFKK